MHVSISHRSRTGGCEDCPLRNIIMYWNRQSLEPPSSTPVGDTTYTPHLLFCTKLNPEHFLFEELFDIMWIFAGFSLKGNLLCCFGTFFNFKNGILWCPLVPPSLGIVYAPVRNGILNNFYFEIFFDIMRNFDRIEPADYRLYWKMFQSNIVQS